MTLIEWMPFSVLVPLIAAPVCALLPGRMLPWLLALLAAAASTLIAALVLPAAMAGPLSYAFGNWPPPIGIEYRVDGANAFVALLVSGLAVLATLWGRKSVDDELGERQGVFYSLFLLALAGLMGITLTGDAFNVFVFLEISSLSTYALIAHGPDRRALLASFRYLIMGTVGATFFLIGVGFLYIMTGTLNMVDLAERLPQVADTRTVQVALAFIIVGMGLKLAMLPLHLWLPNAYTYAPNFISVFIAGTATKVALYVMIRMIYTVFGADYSYGVLPLAAVFLALALAGMFIGAWTAIFQANLKRMLAWSSISQVGYMLLGLALGTAAGLTASFLHLFNHALIKAALFMAVGTVAWRVGSVRIEAFHGLGRQMPWTMTAFALAGLSIIGIPTTAGFISKWYLIMAAMDAGQPWLVALIVISSLMAVIYVWRVVEAAWFKSRPAEAEPVREAPLALLVPLWLVVGLNFWFGLDTRLPVAGATAAAQALIGSTGALP
ncbi:monovalent cation/H+ antiporter subunit D family protein [Wenzhouxiangella sp. XN201]|uniref:monovalent cation/H+ antiporter subunit D family protein n=1 Tax=Wenzhouxiangella sp. XN201 TaxID=2710755 RepID=UPI001969EDC9|nr:monovalent cation/H+ antiporter subunit D family protein [Wenzhouxiangella sp. XN201]